MEPHAVSLALALLAAPAPIDGVSFTPAVAPVHAPVDQIDDLIEGGRQLLLDGHPEEAQTIFEDAAERDGQSFRTRMWVVRSWMPQGRINDALDATDDLVAAGAKGPDVDYLYGMGFWHKGRKNREIGADLAVVEMVFEDAFGYLRRATAADAERYRDAFLPLAETAWFAQDTTVARGAADRAVRLQPENDEAQFLLGRIALSQYKIASDAERRTEADDHLETAIGAFQRSVRLVGRPRGDAARVQLAGRHLQLGYAHVWNGSLEEANKSFANALGWSPGVVDLATVQGYFDAEGFRTCLKRGQSYFRKRHGEKDAADAAILWWLGWQCYELKDYEGAEKAFLRAVKKRPDYVNSWYYVALSRYHRRDFTGAVEGFHEGWNTDPTALVAALSKQRALSLSVLDYLVETSYGREDLLAAAELSEIQAGVAPDVATYWNNVGLFYRDGGKKLDGPKARSKDRTRARECYEKSYEAYSVALSLRPEDPSLINDTAVVLQYYLKRDLDRARRMYRRAIELADRELARPDLPRDSRALYQKARSDARLNLKALDGEGRGGRAPTPDR